MVGARVGRIRIVDLIGRGGMGEVYTGFDDKLERRVALKAIRHDKRLDAEARARFLREARVLSQLDHPCICRLYELIEAPEADYLVLELIEGQSLKQALDEGLDEVAALFVAEKIAEALAAAHAKGVAHRDLKPDNVMLTHDGLVKVLDFGLAQTNAADSSKSGEGTETDRPIGATAVPDGHEPTLLDFTSSTESDTVVNHGDADTALDIEALDIEALDIDELDIDALDVGHDTAFHTQLGMVMGTIAYMSPEQARGERATAASDLYSLGLVMQQMFTGELAYEQRQKPIEMLFKAASGSTLPIEGVDPDLTQLIERLQSMSPEARPSAAETRERLWWIRGKRARRWRRLAAAAVVALLFLAAIKYTFDLRHERSLALAAQSDAEQVSEFLVDIFALSDPTQNRGAEITARELLDAGAQRIASLEAQPASRARMLLTMGRAYRQLGLYERARPLLAEALAVRQLLSEGVDANSEATLDDVTYIEQLASLDHDIGDYASAEPLYRQALDIRRHELGNEHQHVAASLNNLAFIRRARGADDDAETLFKEALDIQRRTLGAEHPDVASTLANLGELYRARGDLEAAASALERAIELKEQQLGRQHPALASSLNNLALVSHARSDLARDDPARAEALYLRTLELVEQVFGSDHPNVAATLGNLAELYRLTGRTDEALPLHRRALDIQTRAVGSDHPAVAVSLSNLAALLVTIGDEAGAEAAFRQALETQQALPADHPSLVATLAGLADSCRRQGRLDEARALYEQALDGAETRRQANPRNRAANGRLAALRVGWGQLLAASGDLPAARRAWVEAANAMALLVASSDAVAWKQTRVMALLYLGRADQVRAPARELLALGWSDPEFLEMCHQLGWIAQPTATALIN